MSRQTKPPGGLKVAIIGYTPHREEAPWAPEHKDTELWMLNDLYLQKLPPFDPKRVRWFAMHPWDQKGPDGKPAMYSNDRAHTQVLATLIKQGARVYLKEERPELPGALAFPYEEVYAHFQGKLAADLKYFTNTISFQIALAMMEGATEIGLYGVDMMTGGRGAINNEYGYQRPSCEYWIAAAEFSGIKVHLPTQSDLIKSAYVYGDYDGGLFRAKIENRMQQLHGVIAQIKGQMNQLNNDLQQHVGALGQLEAFHSTWLPGDDGSPDAPAPQPQGRSAKTGERIALEPEIMMFEPQSDGPVHRIALLEQK